MCGIAGIYRPSALVRIKELQTMSDSLIHRGPDSGGIWTSQGGQIGFAHRRLSIIDLSNLGGQPMSILDGKFVITFNGEIYNYLELRHDLSERGVRFVSQTDTEVLLWMYAEYGSDCLKFLEGMFAFAIWDNEKKQLFVARDRFGEKPFYYALKDGALYFGSEMKSLWATGIPKALCDEGIRDFVIKNNQVDSNGNWRPFYKGIQKLKASHYVIINSSLEIEEVRYWSLDYIDTNSTISFEEAVEEYRTKFISSLKRRMRSDVPLGSSLSGGIDSSTIVCLIDALKVSGQKQKVFSARFPNFEKDEGEFIKRVTNKCKDIDAHEVYPLETEILEILDKVAYHQEEPIGSSSILAQWTVMKLAKENDVTVLLDGQGADEFLGGYLPSYKTYLNQLYSTRNRNYKHELEQFNLRTALKNSRYDLASEFSARQKLGRYRRMLLRQEIPHITLKNQMKRLLTGNSLEVLLRYADRNSMAHSLEVRLPFLDHTLVEFVFTLPDHYILRNGWSKYLHRTAFNDVLPREICWRTDKVGYEPPQNEWLKAPMVADIIRQQQQYFDLNSSSLIDKSYTNSMRWRLLVSYFMK